MEKESVNHNLKCNVCGENRFDEREGFYYCEECGTKHDQVRLVEVERDEDFDQEVLKTKKQTIHVPKAEKPQLTSWECYNYILRGFVEELLSLGAKEELKLMTLQVWAAYLRRMEVAFFSRKQPDLPKLGIKYLHNDAQTIYNHSKEVGKKRRRRRSEDTSCASGEQSTRRSWNRSKQKLDESNYSLTSATSGGSGFTSSTSANSNRAIKIRFSSKAKAFFKRKMPVKHLEKHGADAEGKLKCHQQPKARDVNRTDYNMMLINTRQIYSIIAIALNLIGDDIQLCDLVRFISEGHLSASNVLQYFPENIAGSGKEMLSKMNFYKCPEKFSDKCLRDHIGTLCKNLGIHTLKNPDIIKLVQRYTTELCLPTDIACFIERLINLMPPNFNTRVEGFYPCFEARAMAYIIFTLKLLFGLDDCKEHRISRASKTLNSKIEQLNIGSNEKQPLLFVWNEWMEYIEMRKVIISQFNTSYCDQFKQCQSTSQVLEQMSEEMRKNEERNNLHNDKDENQLFTHKLKNFKLLFERFQETSSLTEKDNKPPVLIDFKPSFTPSLSYLKNILLVCNKEPTTNAVHIPDFMHIDHSQRNVESFLKVKPLMEYFKKHQLNLKAHVLPTTANREHIGIFRTPFHKIKKPLLHKACFEVTEEEWHETVVACNANNTDDLQFCSDFTTYCDYYQQKLLGTKQKKFFNPLMNYDLKRIHDDKHEGNENDEIPEEKVRISTSNRQCNEDVQSMLSFEVFSENNMDPVDTKDFITRPRRNFENIDLFEGISDEESVLNKDDDDDGDVNEGSKENNQNISVSEVFIKKEPGSGESPETPKNNPTTGSDESFKMYISNMDCWMILGNILKTTKLHKNQLQDKFPRSFNWLLETCAQTINVEWASVFEQLLCIETMFCLGIKDPKTIKNCVYVNSHNANKEMQMVIGTYREIW